MNGVIISKENQTVRDRIDQQYVDTQTPLFKLYLSNRDKRTYVNQNITDTFTIPHNLGYVPMFFLYADRADGAIRKIVLNIDTSYPENQVLWTCFADNKNINVTVTGSSVTGTFGYNYFIFYDKVGE